MTLTRRIWHIGHVMVIVLLLLSTRIVYWQLFRGQTLQPVVLDPSTAAAQYQTLGGGSVIPAGPATFDDLPQPVVQRTRVFLAGIKRGTIFDQAGRPLAYDYEEADGTKARFYAEPSLAHVTGYVSGLRTGVTGIERTFNVSLLGLNRIDTQINQMLYQPIVGSDVYLTIDSRTQRAAAEALGDRAGAVVALDAETGAVLAMVSRPGFDPNQVQNVQYVTNLLANCGTDANCQSAFVNRAAQGLFVPGSTWKTVTLVAALDSGLAQPDTMFDVGPPLQDGQGQYYAYWVDGGKVIDRNHPEAVLNLQRAYVTSANAVFAQLGDELGGETLINYAQRLGFGRGEPPPLEIETSAARLANDPDALERNNLLRAVTAIGQGELLASPLSVALMVTAVVNEGDMPEPHLLASVRHPSGAVLRKEPQAIWSKNIMAPETARQVRQMMIALVDRGSPAAVPGLTVGGKTGTAEVGDNKAPHAWFAGFAANETRTVAIAVIVENGGQGSSVAAPIFARVADAALNHYGEPVEEVVPPPVARE
ncbi:MAG: penicillin-binding protein 2 [Anaerolineae bacterium]|nr:penicillin-binding protein 2 [Anaerolineae bacterium]